MKFREPFFMAAGLLVLFLIIFLLHFMYALITGQIMDLLNIWMYMMGAAMVFSIFSTINLVYAQNTSRYYYKTIMAFATLVLVGAILSTFISGQSIFDLPTYRKVLIFVIIAFLAFISIASMIKRLDEWSRNYDKNFLNNNKDDSE